MALAKRHENSKPQTFKIIQRHAGNIFYFWRLKQLYFDTHKINLRN